MTRKIIQITQAPHVDYGNSQFLYALCDDGTVWFQEWDGDSQNGRSVWRKVAPIPQDEDAPMFSEVPDLPARVWPPHGITRLWHRGDDGKAQQILDNDTLVIAAAAEELIVESSTVQDAQLCLDRPLFGYEQSLTHEGHTYKIVSIEIPF